MCSARWLAIPRKLRTHALVLADVYGIPRPHNGYAIADHSRAMWLQAPALCNFHMTDAAGARANRAARPSRRNPCHTQGSLQDQGVQEARVQVRREDSHWFHVSLALPKYLQLSAGTALPSHWSRLCRGDLTGKEGRDSAFEMLE